MTALRKFLLKKFPPSRYMDCPIPKHHWETIEEYALQQRTEGIKEGFEAARCRKYLSPYNKYNTADDYLNSKK